MQAVVRLFQQFWRGIQREMRDTVCDVFYFGMHE